MRVLLMATVLLLAASTAAAQEQAPNRREFTIVARSCAFTPARIEVARDDLVRIVLRSADAPHGFAIDAYRIMKRVPAGGTIAFEFRADVEGAFPFYCNLSADDGCQDMKGTLVVRPR